MPELTTYMKLSVADRTKVPEKPITRNTICAINANPCTPHTYTSLSKDLRIAFIAYASPVSNNMAAPF